MAGLESPAFIYSINMNAQSVDNIIVSDGDDEWLDYAIRFVANLYGLVAYYFKSDDEHLIMEIVGMFTAFIDGKAPDVREFVQPLLGFVVNPAEYFTSEVAGNNIPPTVVLPSGGRTDLTGLAGMIVRALHKNPYFDGVRYSMMPPEKLLELKRITGLDR